MSRKYFGNISENFREKGGFGVHAGFIHAASKGQCVDARLPDVETIRANISFTNYYRSTVIDRARRDLKTQRNKSPDPWGGFPNKGHAEKWVVSHANSFVI